MSAACTASEVCASLRPAKPLPRPAVKASNAAWYASGVSGGPVGDGEADGVDPACCALLGFFRGELVSAMEIATRIASTTTHATGTRIRPRRRGAGGTGAGNGYWPACGYGPIGWYGPAWGYGPACG